MKKTISILGSTGSVGLSTLSIIDKKKKFFKVKILSANKNYKLIANQIIKYKPTFFIITNYKIFLKIKNKFSNNKTIILNKFQFNSSNKSDISVIAIPGIAGLEPTISMIKMSKKVLLANKEAIICGWSLIRNIARKYKTKIVPVDSEHYSIFKLIENHKLSEIKKIYITASGGPFLNYKPEQFKKIKIEDALRHPKWKMGKKVTIDSATLMNKMLELIEAQKLFNISDNKIDILVHPDSLVHAIVEFNNGLIKFIYHETSMIIPLANAIFEGKLNISEFYKTKDKKFVSNIKNLVFKLVDKKTFPIIKLKKRLNEHPSSSIIINASNEILVDQFLQKKIPFLSIFKIIMTILNDRNFKKYAIKKPKNIYQIYNIDNWARNKTLEKLKLK